MKRRKFGAIALLGTIAACGSGGGSDSLLPITGVIVRAETLTTGFGCGRGASQVFKYAAVVIGRNGSGEFDQFVAGNVYDCFGDGLFVDLPASGGSFQYRVQIYAYNETAYRMAGDATIRAAVLSTTGLKTTNPTLTTTCAAQQIELVQTLAVCKPLALGAGGVGPQPTPAAPATVTLTTGAFPGPDGGVVGCNTEYAFVRSRYSVGGGAVTDAVEIPCSTIGPSGLETATITVSPAVAPAAYLFEVALLRSDRVVLGQTTCRASTSAGVTSPAVCQPIH